VDRSQIANDMPRPETPGADHADSRSDRKRKN
jgi:hypothetical protein